MMDSDQKAIEEEIYIEEIAKMLFMTGYASVTTDDIKGITKGLKKNFKMEVTVTRFIRLGEYFLQKVSG
jgi:hypothetical protein